MELNTQTINTPPRPAATVLMLRDAPQGLEVLLIKRHAQSEVLGGAYVFPGGKVDAADAQALVLSLLDQPAQTLQERLCESGISAAQAAAIFIAATREVFEESGILFAQNVSVQQTAQAQALLRAGHGFEALLSSAGLRLSVSALLPWSRWITPKTPSVMNKRFDTRFFVAALPLQQTAQHDEHEATDSVWLRPSTALDRYWANQIALAPPQIMSLVHLLDFDSVRSVLQAACAQPPPLIEPESFEQDGTRVVCYPGDPRHAVAARAMPGPTRLIYRNRRFEPEQGFAGFFDRTT